jgi:hypothetical protein
MAHPNQQFRSWAERSFEQQFSMRVTRWGNCT